MIVPTSRWQRFSSPSASALLARALHGPYVMSSVFLSTHAAEPLGLDQIDPAGEDDVVTDAFNEPVIGENDIKHQPIGNL